MFMVMVRVVMRMLVLVVVVVPAAARLIMFMVMVRMVMRMSAARLVSVDDRDIRFIGARDGLYRLQQSVRFGCLDAQLPRRKDQYRLLDLRQRRYIPFNFGRTIGAAKLFQHIYLVRQVNAPL